MSQATAQPLFDFTVSLKTGRKCAHIPLGIQKDDPLHKKQKTQTKREVSKRKVLALYEDYLKKRVKETWPNCRMGNRLFEEIKARGYRGSPSTVKKFLLKVRNESDFPKEVSLSHYKGYLKKRLEEVQPNCLTAKKLFAEITARGYRGSLSVLNKFLWIMRKKIKAKEASIQFHKKYLIERVKETYPEHISGTRLFEEITAKGYRGSVGGLQGFLSVLRKQEKRPSEASLDFHKEYLTKKIKDAFPHFVSSRQLFEEIQAKGYRGSFSAIQGFLSALRKKEKKPSENLSSASVEFHKDYLTKRLEETYPSYVSGTQLFKEIRARGYRGAATMFRVFLSTLRKKEKKPKDACVEFHKEYLSKRLKEAYPNFIPAWQLLEEIQAKGYRGSLSTLQRFLSVLRKKRPSNAYLEFHRDYLIKRLEETCPSYVSGKELFQEIRAKGYQGGFSSLQGFLTTLRQQEKNPSKKPLEVCRNGSSEASLQFHKDYLIKTLQETWPIRLTPKQLFEEIISRGYRGTCKEVEVFLMMISK